MKKLKFYLLLVLASAFLPFSGYSQKNNDLLKAGSFSRGDISRGDIISTAEGGAWHDANTWVNGVVPAADDNVIIDGNVDIWFDHDAVCKNLTVNIGDTLSTVTTDTWGTSLTVNGDLTNYGYVTSDGGDYSLSVKGNLTNNGSISGPELFIDGTDFDQTIITNEHINAYTFIHANVNNATSFQWFRDDLDVTDDYYTYDDAIRIILQNGENDNDYGTYYCQTDAGTSRKIYLKKTAHECIDPTSAYVVNFEDGENLDGWAAIDNNGDGSTWALYYDIGINGTIGAGYVYNEDNNADDWLISPCLQLEKEKYYEVKFYYAVADSEYPEKLAVFYAPSYDSLGNNLLIDLGTVTNTEYQKFDTVIKIDQPGSYYFGWYCYSMANSYNLYVDSISWKQVEGPSAIADHSINNKLMIYPNPADDLIEVTLSGEKMNKIEIYSVNGSLIKTWRFNDQTSKTLNIANLNAGIYFIKATGNKKTSVKKLIKR
jgi:hypothetical protein